VSYSTNFRRDAILCENGDLDHSAFRGLAPECCFAAAAARSLQEPQIKRKIMEFWEKSATIGDAVHSFAPAGYVTSSCNCQSLGQFSSRTDRGTIQ
jgi:hypothetical protein